MGASVPASSPTSPGKRGGGAWPRNGVQVADGVAGAVSDRVTEERCAPKGKRGRPRATTGPTGTDAAFLARAADTGGRVGAHGSPGGKEATQTTRAGGLATREREGAGP